MSNILITGAAGYIGGTLLDVLLKQHKQGLELGKLHVTVRTADQASALSSIGATVIRVDLRDENAVKEAVVQHEIDIVIHCASAIDASLAKSLIAGLQQRKKLTGNEAHFIHTSGASAYADTEGWQHGPVKDTDAVYSLNKQIETPGLARDTDTAVLEYAVQCGVPAYSVNPPLVFGRGSGASNQLSFTIPLFVRTFMRTKAVYKLPIENQWSAVHVVDLANYYVCILQAIKNGTPLPSGYDGYMFPSTHQFSYSELLEHLAAALHEMGYIDSAEVKTWPSKEAACKDLGIGPEVLRTALCSNTIIIPVKGETIGWKPEWNKERFLQNLKDEVKDVVELGATSKMMTVSLAQD
ncbi:hypothetical protein B0I35DRAFT_45103 [Stachybotrys elegans]|uniref:NAD-dependent epimerase/dehydratase domain-containing protein n=1 Tax=Stachybotrys elegans TaxID=80388 RepID=A0A8K0WYE9_9HYPO|nr:hypothetical protein B0I35DRAFT_45103 [Stachybotrys elegans]